MCIIDLYEYLKYDIMDSDLYYLYNEYANRSGENALHQMRDIDAYLSNSNLSIMEILKRTNNNFDINDNYYYIDRDNNIISFAYMDDCPIVDYDKLVQYIIDNEKLYEKYEKLINSNSY